MGIQLKTFVISMLQKEVGTEYTTYKDKNELLSYITIGLSYCFLNGYGTGWSGKRLYIPENREYHEIVRCPFYSFTISFQHYNGMAEQKTDIVLTTKTKKLIENKKIFLFLSFLLLFSRFQP